MTGTGLKKSKQLVVLIALNIVFTFGGAILFIKLEECIPQGAIEDKEEKDFVRYLEGIENISVEEHANFLNVSTKYFQLANRRTCSFKQETIAKWWEFTIVSSATVGFGNTTPKTQLGKVMTMLYTIIGIPLTMAMYAVAGELMIMLNNVIITVVERKILKRATIQGLKKKRASLTAVMLILVILSTSTLVKSTANSLTYIDCVYFTFQTATTIGYGDIGWQRRRSVQRVLFIFVLSSFGMGLIASLISAASSTIQYVNAPSIRKLSKSSEREKVNEDVVSNSFEL